VGVDPGYDCENCGACCTDPEGGTGYVSLSRNEAKRMHRLGLRVVSWSAGHFLGTRARAEGGRACVAFRGNVGRPCGCSVYAERPFVCRVYEVGSPECRRARADAGLPA
jgi:Fe-S-cluster containining protein